MRLKNVGFNYWYAYQHLLSVYYDRIGEYEQSISIFRKTLDVFDANPVYIELHPWEYKKAYVNYLSSLVEVGDYELHEKEMTTFISMGDIFKVLWQPPLPLAALLLIQQTNVLVGQSNTKSFWQKKKAFTPCLKKRKKPSTSLHKPLSNGTYVC